MIQKLFLILILATIASITQAQYLSRLPDSIVLRYKNELPDRQPKKTPDFFRQGRLSVGDFAPDQNKLIDSNAKGDIYRLADGMLCLRPKAEVLTSNSMPGTIISPFSLIPPANPIPNPFLPNRVWPKP